MVRGLLSGGIFIAMAACGDHANAPADAMGESDGSSLSCGNGIVDPGEQCDPLVSLTATCEEQGFYAGTLLCSSCMLDTTACGGRCGDQIINGAETCDGSTPVGCAQLGLTLGTTTCIACTVDASSCKSADWSVSHLGMVSLRGLWGSSVNDVWAAGTTPMHWDGTSWSPIFPSPPGADAVWGTSATDVTMINSGQMMQFDGVIWHLGLPGLGLASDVERLWGTGPDNLYAIISTGTLHHWDGIGWSDVDTGTTGFVHAVWGSSADSIWISASGTGPDQILHFDGTSWTIETTDSPIFFASLTGCGASVFAAGGDGTGSTMLLRRDPTGWHVIPNAVTVDVFDLTCTNDKDLLVMGRLGPTPYDLAVLWYDGNFTFSLDFETPPQGTPPAGVWGSPHTHAFMTEGDLSFGDALDARAAWGLGGDFVGPLWRSSQDLWSINGTQVLRNGVVVYTHPNQLRAISGVGDAWVVVVGDLGSAAIFDGTTWTAIATGAQYNLNGVWARSETDIVAVGDAGTVLHSDGVAWATMIPNAIAGGNYNGVWGAGAADLFVVGTSGQVLHFDGAHWQEIHDQPFAPDLEAVWAASSTQVFAVGDNGTIITWDGTNWTTLAPELGEDVLAVHGVDPSDVFMVSRQGTVFRWDGHLVTSVRTFGGNQQAAVWVAPDEVYVSGLGNGAALIR